MSKPEVKEMSETEVNIFETNEGEFKCEECEKTFDTYNSLRKHLPIHVSAEDKKFQCNICYKTFMTARTLMNHKVLHTGRKDFKCKVCKKCFTDGGKLSRHARIHTGEKPYRCKKCGRAFTCSSGLRAHETIHTGQRDYKCQFCEKAFRRLGDCQIHERTHTGDRPFKCENCQKGFMSRSSLAAHKKKHSDERKFKCDECTASYKFKAQLKAHYLQHTGEKPHICDLCGKTYQSQNGLAIHLKGHAGIKPHHCKLCEWKFKTKGDLARHMRSHTGEKTKKCKICGMMFGENYKLKRHMLVHSEAKFKCDICERVFKQKSSLHGHMISHAQAKSYKCNLCPKAFSCRQSFQYHLKRHNKDTPYICHMCNKGFVSVGALKLHFTSHSENRPYKCEICQKGFKQRVHLERHLWCHADDKPFKCSHCQKSFGYADGLESHMAIHINELPYKCRICSKTFRRTSALNAHKFKIHKLRYRCAVCRMRFSDSKTLVKHVAKHAEDKQKRDKQEKCDLNRDIATGIEPITEKKTRNNESLNCAACSKYFLDSRTLQRHLIMHTENDCNEDFETAFSQLTCLQGREDVKNLPINNDEKSLFCDVHDKSFSNSENWHRHTIHHDEKSNLKDEKKSISCLTLDEQREKRKPFKCGVCKRTYNHIEELDKHLKRHDKEYFLKAHSNNKKCTDKKHNCRDEENNEISSSLSSLDTEKKENPNKTSNLKRKIDNEFVKEYLKCTVEKTTEEEQPPLKFKRVVPFRILKNNSDNVKELLTYADNESESKKAETENISNDFHNQKKPVDITFEEIPIVSQNMKNKKLKNEDDSFKCTVCQKNFCDSKAFQKHIRCHVTEDLKIVLCDVLKAEFCNRELLTGIFFNTKDGITKVGDCEQKTLSKKELKLEENKCDVCGKEFSDSGTLRRHLHNHTEIDSNDSEVFEKAFSQLSYLLSGNINEMDMKIPTSKTNKRSSEICSSKEIVNEKSNKENQQIHPKQSSDMSCMLYASKENNQNIKINKQTDNVSPRSRKNQVNKSTKCKELMNEIQSPDKIKIDVQPLNFCMNSCVENAKNKTKLSNNVCSESSVPNENVNINHDVKIEIQPVCSNDRTSEVQVTINPNFTSGRFLSSSEMEITQNIKEENISPILNDCTDQKDLINYRITKSAEIEDVVQSVKVENHDTSKLLTEKTQNSLKFLSWKDLNSCSVCRKQFSDLRTLKRHLTIHTVEESDNYMLFEKAFNQLAKLSDEINVEAVQNKAVNDKMITQNAHVREKTHQREMKIAKYSKTSNVKENSQDCLKINSDSSVVACRDEKTTDSLICQVCRKVFLESGTLKRHLEYHTESAMFSNPESFEQAFRQLANLRVEKIARISKNTEQHQNSRHVSSSRNSFSSNATHGNKLFHTKEKNQGRDSCPSSINKESQNANNTLEILICVVCQKTFSDSKILKRHLNMHTRDEDNFDDFEKAFNQLTRLNTSKTEETNLDAESHIPNQTKDFAVVRRETTVKGFDTQDHKKSKNISKNFHKGLNSHSKDSFVCDIWRKSLSESKNLKKRISESVEKESIICKVCKEIFSDEETLKKHASSHESDTNSCTVCKKKFLDPGTLRRHLFIHTKGDRNNSDVFEMAFNQLTNLNNNKEGLSKNSINTNFLMNNIDKKKSIDCSAEKNYSSIFDQLSSNLVSFQNRDNVCDVCNMTFTDILSLKRHRKTHSTIKSQDDEGNNINLKIFESHRKHQDKEPYSCSVCDVFFSEVGTLRRHLQMHTEADSQDSRVFEKAFCQLANLHGQENEDKSFSNVSTKEKNITNNVGECSMQKSETCEHICKEDKSLQKSALIHQENVSKYQRDETDFNYENGCDDAEQESVKLYECYLCERECDDAEELQRHILTNHNNEKPHKCNLCERSFIYSESLKRHMLVHQKRALVNDVIVS